MATSYAALSFAPRLCTMSDGGSQQKKFPLRVLYLVGFLCPFSEFLLPFLSLSRRKRWGIYRMGLNDCVFLYMCCVRNSLIPSLISTAEKRKRKQEKFWEYRTTFVEKITRAVQFFLSRVLYTHVCVLYTSQCCFELGRIFRTLKYSLLAYTHKHGNNTKLSVLTFPCPSGLNVLSLNIT